MTVHEQIYMLYAYPKNELENLTAAQKAPEADRREVVR